MLQDFCYIIPPHLYDQMRDNVPQCSEELRFRTGWPVSAVVNGEESVVTQDIISARELSFILSAASKNAAYSLNESLKNGFLVLTGGHRLSICGQAVMERGEIKTIRDLTSVSVRISRQIKGIAPVFDRSTLIAGVPGSGKTTMLQDAVRNISEKRKQRVGLVDERGEVACCIQGSMMKDLGRRTDVLTGCPKKIGIPFLVRNMNPQWIALDEITKEEDANVLLNASYCGVKFLATVHASDRDELYLRPVYRRLMKSGIFKKLLFMRQDHSFWQEDVQH